MGWKPRCWVAAFAVTMGALAGACDDGELSLFDDGPDGDEIGVEVGWEEQLSTSVDDVAQAVQAADGAIFVAGATRGELCEGCKAGGDDAFLRRYDADGRLEWTRQFGTERDDRALAVAVDGDAVYVTGSTRGDMAAEGEVDSVDVFVRRFDFDGEVGWTRQFGAAFDGAASGAEDVPTGIGVSNGLVAVAGHSTRVMGNPNRPARRAFVHALSGEGRALWADDFQVERSPTRAFDVGVAADAVYVVGDVPNMTSAVQAGWDAFARRYDSAGRPLWTERFERSEGAGSDTARAVVVDGEALYVAGETVDIDEKAAQTRHFLTKLDLDGGEAWTRFQRAPMPAIALQDGTVAVAGGAAEPGDDTREGLSFRRYGATGDLLVDARVDADGLEDVADMAVDGEVIYLVGSSDGVRDPRKDPDGRDGFILQLRSAP